MLLGFDFLHQPKNHQSSSRLGPGMGWDVMRRCHLICSLTLKFSLTQLKIVGLDEMFLSAVFKESMLSDAVFLCLLGCQCSTGTTFRKARWLSPTCGLYTEIQPFGKSQMISILIGFWMTKDNLLKKRPLFLLG